MGSTTAGDGPTTSPTDPAAGWRRGLEAARRGERRVRVVVLGDSIAELDHGFDPAFNEVQASLVGAVAPGWVSPTGVLPLSTQSGTAGPWGIDAQGTTLDEGQSCGTAGNPLPCDEVAVQWEAHPGGPPIDLLVDDEHVATIATGADEHGRSVTEPLAGCRWVSGSLRGEGHTILVTAAGAGGARIEGIQLLVEGGFDIRGRGCSGRSTRELLDGGRAVATIEAMASRGEPPDLLLYASDTAKTDRSADETAADVLELDRALRGPNGPCPEASVLYYVPHRHAGPTYHRWLTDYVPKLRQLSDERRFLVLDGAAVIGDITAAGDASDLGEDEVHLSPEGQRVLHRAIVDTLLAGVDRGSIAT